MADNCKHLDGWLSTNARGSLSASRGPLCSLSSFSFKSWPMQQYQKSHQARDTISSPLLVTERNQNRDASLTLKQQHQQKQQQRQQSSVTPKCIDQTLRRGKKWGRGIVGFSSSEPELLLPPRSPLNSCKRDCIMRIISSLISLSLAVLALANVCAAVVLAQPRASVEYAQDVNLIRIASNASIEGRSDSPRMEPFKVRGSRDTRLGDKFRFNSSHIVETLFKKKPYSKYWTAEQKWDDLFRRAMSVQDDFKQLLLKNMLRDAEYYADLSLSKACEDDLKFIQNYARKSTNFRWLLHMIDSTGKNEPGMLTGNLAFLGHPVQCIKVRAPGRPSNHSFSERYFEQQTELLGERFRGKYCLASVRPVLPPKPHLVSRFSSLFNESILSNISYMGEPTELLKQRSRQLSVPASDYAKIDRRHLRHDQAPFESELYSYIIAQRNFMYSLPRFMGVCYPSSCSREDIRIAMQKTLDDQHQVVDIEFECEQEDQSLWEWLITPRLLSYVLLSILFAIVLAASLSRYIIVDKMGMKRSRLPQESRMAGLLDALDMLSMDKCAGILFVKTKQASPYVDWTKVENSRSTPIDSLRGFLILVSIYSQLIMLGCLPIPFMWTKWADAMFPFFRMLYTQIFTNMAIWTEAFYTISAYLISVKFLENNRPRSRHVNAPDSAFFKQPPSSQMPVPNFFSYASKRYVRLVAPMVGFIFLNYVWPRMSNGFVMQDQANKLMSPCDTFGWTNLFLFHNHQGLNETCLWPSHVSASFFQLHLISYPIILLCLMCVHSEFYHNDSNFQVRAYNCNNINSVTSSGYRKRKMLLRIMRCSTYGLIGALALVGAIYPALKASGQELIVPFLIDYIDYDNYQRVLEWVVLPTYNHLTSYSFGILVAFLVIQRKARRELRLASALSDTSYNRGENASATADTAGNFIHRDNSLDSVRSSSTQELHSATVDGLTDSGFQYQSHPTSNMAMNKLKFTVSTCTSSSVSDFDLADDDSHSQNWLKTVLSFAGASIVILLTLTSSWFWNGLGQPMTKDQTFWFVMLTKLTFSGSFAYVFYKYFATRRNCNNPWMVTRFLVPIGRMSLTVFYTSWLVIWFDLLSSPYQWHPSHYFVFEKFTEITVITLILSMLSYGIFEGIVKRIHYSIRSERVIRDKKYLASMNSESQLQQKPNLKELARKQVKAFEHFFDPIEKKMLEEERHECVNQSQQGKQISSELDRLSGVATTKTAGDQAINKLQQHYTRGSHGTTRLGLADYKLSASEGGYTRSNLSPLDRHKLNAELRASDSFASIGLYESAGATGYLQQLHSSRASLDTQVSSAPGREREQQT